MARLDYPPRPVCKVTPSSRDGVALHTPRAASSSPRAAGDTAEQRLERVRAPLEGHSRDKRPVDGMSRYRKLGRRPPVVPLPPRDRQSSSLLGRQPGFRPTETIGGLGFSTRACSKASNWLSRSMRNFRYRTASSGLRWMPSSLGHRHDFIDVRDRTEVSLLVLRGGQNAGRRSTRGSILRGMSCPSLGEPSSWPFATMTFPLRITVVGQPSTCQPSQGL